MSTTRVTLLAAFVTAFFLLGVVAWFAAGPLIGFAAQSVEVSGDPDRDLPGLRERSVVRAADGAPLAVLSDEFDRETVELDRIPPHVRHAVLAAEDRRFYAHEGYDVNAIMRAAFANFQAGSVEQGASTISQQLAQINFLRGDETIRRKLEEVQVARALEEEYGKDLLLERYLNQVYLGAGSYGVQAGAQQYLGVNVEDLTVEQAALLAGMIRAPTHLDPRNNPRAATTRRNSVLQAMAEERYISRAEANQLADEPLEVVPPRDRSPEEPYVIEAVKREFFNNETFGESVEDRIELLFTGGVEVQTTVDPHLQAVADDVVSDTFPSSEGPTAALVSMNPVTGGIVALHGGKDFDEVQFDLATQGRRQPGSALKPVTAASALEQGISPDISLAGSGPVTLDVPGAIEPFVADNFAGSNYGRVDLRTALVNSVNTAFSELILQSGVEETIELSGQMGINVERAFGPENTWGPAIVLGGLTHGVTPLEMASVYAVFANQGISVKPHLIERVIDGEGQVLYEREGRAEQVLDPAVAAAMVDMLTDVVERGTGTRAQVPGVDVLGKTGTNANGADGWFVGASSLLSTAVWVGHAEAQIPIPDLTGGSIPATIWQEFMEAALTDIDVPPFADDELDRSALPEPEPDEDDDLPAPGSVTPAPPPPPPPPPIQPPPPPRPPPPPPPIATPRPTRVPRPPPPPTVSPTQSPTPIPPPGEPGAPGTQPTFTPP